MQEVRAPEIAPRADVFLAGGILGADDWQPRAVAMLNGQDVIAYNPRRIEPFTRDMHEFQVRWEHDALRNADSILFWFPPETLCPITLFELGVWSNTNKPIYVGTHPDYDRRADVIIQLGLSRPDVIVRDNLEDVVKDFIDSHNNHKIYDYTKKD
jgi:hypothetical protein